MMNKGEALPGWLQLLAGVFLLGVIAVYILPALPGLSVTAGGGTPTPQPAIVQPTVTVAGSCPDTGRVAVRLMGVSSVLSTTGTETAINAVATGIQLKGSTSLIDTITIVNTGYTASTAGSEVPCGGDFNILFPSTTSVAWYNQKIPMKGASAAFIDLKFTADQIGTVVVSGQNATSTPGQATTTLVVSVPASGTDTSLKLALQEGSGAVYRGPIMVGLAYDTINYTDIEVIDATQVACPSGMPIVTDLNLVTYTYKKCFVLAAGDLKNYGGKVINLKVVAGANVVGPTVSGSNWTAIVMDYGARVKNGEVVNEYRNSDTGGTIGAADSTFQVQG